jgi:hypothetical protein
MSDWVLLIALGCSVFVNVMLYRWADEATTTALTYMRKYAALLEREDHP